MKQKAKDNSLNKWFMGFIPVLAALTILVSGCNRGNGEISLEEMLAQGQNGTMETNSTLPEQEIQGDKQIEDTPLSTVWVHICGAVEMPGIYELPAKSRVYDAVALAGGFTAGADTTYYNLAAMVSDGMKIEIPAQADGRVSNTNEGDNGLVNINTATLEQLQTLPGIGQSRATDIIAYREKNGSFKNTAEIMKVSGIKEALYEKIKDLITVE